MHATLMRVFQHQVKTQCEFVAIAYRELQTLRERRQESTVPFFCAIQALIGAAASIRKALWGVSDEKAAARADLRRSLDTDDSSLINTSAMRNHFEHFDDRIDKWWGKSERQNFVDLNIAPTGMFPTQEPINLFREYDPETGDVAFWGNRLNIHEIAKEAERIHLAASRELNKPRVPTAIPRTE